MNAAEILTRALRLADEMAAKMLAWGYTPTQMNALMEHLTGMPVEEAWATVEGYPYRDVERMKWASQYWLRYVKACALCDDLLYDTKTP